ncbi:S24 family peptidase [Sphingosinicella soli]|uniref:Peptidase S24/S26A/S26B/S26C domain-containing protein n=1 Tax=Sphingosinicella soli TaxID=333708 RepID=A0A7W7FAD8_9SPHN|nr:hypothetical protein [Sphingosinicella soli]
MNAVAVRRTLDTLIQARREDYASVSRLIGRNPTYIQQFIRRGVPRKLDEDDRRTLARHFDVPEHVLGGPPARVGQAVVARAAEATAIDDYLLVPCLDAGADDAGAALAFQARWISGLCSGDPQALAVIHVDGDAMEPTLSHGDPVLVDTADGSAALRDGIYALRSGGGVLMKRLTRNPATQGIAIRSDNPRWPDWEDSPAESLDIVGRVIWVGRELR